MLPGPAGPASDQLPETAAALVASQLDVELSAIDPAGLNVERDARAEQLAHAMSISRFRACEPQDLAQLRGWLGARAAALGPYSMPAVCELACSRLGFGGS